MATPLVKLAERAKEQLAEVTGFTPIGATGGFRDEEGWHISVEMLEMTRIPNSSDLIGTYDILLDQDSNMLRFNKKGARLRGEPYEEEQ